MEIYSILIEKIDGSVAVLHPINCSLEQAEKNAKSLPSYKRHFIIDPKTIPDRSLREAWIVDNGVIKECVVRSKEYLRKVRNSLLEEIDKKVFSELRKPNGDVTYLEESAVKLRDITKRDEFNSVEGIKLLLKEIGIK